MRVEEGFARLEIAWHTQFGSHCRPIRFECPPDVMATYLVYLTNGGYLEVTPGYPYPNTTYGGIDVEVNEGIPPNTIYAIGGPTNDRQASQR